MSAIRTQVYLTADQRRRIDRFAEVEGVTMAEVIRRALDSFLDGRAPAAGRTLAESFGSVPDLAVPDRDEWDRR